MAKTSASGLPLMDKNVYERELVRLQAELVLMQEWVKATGNRVVVIFEGRDAAGKGSAIKRITEAMNPRVVRIAALPAPNDREKTQWYFQRYIDQLPAGGEIVLFDRSWYNRAGVERVMGFCTDQQYNLFLRQAPVVEKLLQDDGIILLKYWFSVSDVEQEARFHARLSDPLRRWKLSPMDLQSISRWEDYSRAKDVMMEYTDTVDSPWFTVESEDKKASRLNVMHHLLSKVPYSEIAPVPVEIPKRPKAKEAYGRPPRESQRYVPDHAAAVMATAGRRPEKRGKKARTKGADKADEKGTEKSGTD